MFDDDDYPDYFLEGGNDTESELPPTEDTPRAGNTITFCDSGQTSADSDNIRDHGFGCGFKAGCLAVFIIVILGAIGYFRYLTPTVDDAVMDVYIQKVERRGVFFKTYEAEIVEPSRLYDTNISYTHPRSISISDEKLARLLQELQASGRIVRLRYQQYAAALPWRGESKIVVINVE